MEVVEVVELEIGKNDDRANEIVEVVKIVGGDNETQKKPKHDQKKVKSVCTILKEALIMVNKDKNLLLVISMIFTLD